MTEPSESARRVPAGRPIQLLRKHLRGEFGTGVRCGSCTTCCRAGYRIDLRPDEGEGLDVVEEGGHRQVRRREDGSCIHLGEHGCTVYEKRPEVCRTYDCRLMALAGTPLGSNPTLRVDPTLMRQTSERWRFDLSTREDIAAALAYRLAVHVLFRISGLPVEAALALALTKWESGMRAAEALLKLASDETRREVIQSLETFEWQAGWAQPTETEQVPEQPSDPTRH